MSKTLNDQELKEQAREDLQLISETLKDEGSKTIFREQLVHGFSIMSNTDGERYEKFKARMWDGLNNSMNTLLNSGNTLPKNLFPLLKDLTTNPDAKKLIDSIEYKFVKDYPQLFTESKAKDSTSSTKSEPVAESKAKDSTSSTKSEPVAESKAKDSTSSTKSEPVAESKAKDSTSSTKSEPVNVQEKTEQKTNSSNKLLDEIVSDLEKLVRDPKIKKGIGLKNSIELEKEVNHLKSNYKKVSTLEEKSNGLVENLDKLQTWSNEKSAQTKQPIFAKVKNLFSSMGKVIKSTINKDEEKLRESKIEYFQAKQNLFHTKDIKNSLNHVRGKAQDYAEKIRIEKEEAASQKPRIQ